MKRTWHRGLLAGALLGARVIAAPAQTLPPPGPQPPAATQKLAHDMLRDLVAVHSVHDVGTKAAADVVVRYLKAGGFKDADIHEVADPQYPRQVNVVVRLKGHGAGKPVMWMGHLDVVEAKAADWSLPPFQLTEKDGWFYGRGTVDMKDGDAAMAASLIRLRQEGYVPARDIVAAFTADEELGREQDGPLYLVTKQRPLVDAALVINADGDSGGIENGKRLTFEVETGEKTYVTYHLDVANKGGHSSQPRPDNAIYQLADGLAKLSHYSFPFRFNDTTRSYFRQMAAFHSGGEKADMLAVAADKPDLAAAERLTADIAFNPLLHSTCVATMLDAGVQENALPAHAQATVQCRIMPGETVAGTKATLEKVIADPQIRVSVFGMVTEAPASPLDPKLMAAVETVAHGMWPGVPVVPAMAAGASDSIFTRNAGIPSYGVSGGWSDIHDERAHGRDERIQAGNFYASVEFTYRLMKALTAP